MSLGRKLLIGFLVASLLCCTPCGAIALVGAFSGTKSVIELLMKNEAECSGIGAAVGTNINVNVGGFTTQGTQGTQTWDAKMVRNAAIIVQVGNQKGVPPRGWLVAVAAGMQESTLRSLANSNVPQSMNLPNEGVGSDHQSVGIHQGQTWENDSTGWGLARELLDPVYDSLVFYFGAKKAAPTYYEGKEMPADAKAYRRDTPTEGLIGVPNWQNMSVGEAAQQVERSATPGAHGRWEEDAKQLVAHVSGIKIDDLFGGGCTVVAHCGPQGEQVTGTPPQVVNGWANPVPGAPGWGSFGPRGDGFHWGVDLMAKPCTPIYSPSDGKVSTIACNYGQGEPGTRLTPQNSGPNAPKNTSCDHDGHGAGRGCGWYIVIEHTTKGASGGFVATGHCHLIQAPVVAVGEQVRVGQLIGFVGASGGAKSAAAGGSGEHNHSEVLDGCQALTSGTCNVDPQVFYRSKGVPGVG